MNGVGLVAVDAEFDQHGGSTHAVAGRPLAGHVETVALFVANGDLFVREGESRTSIPRSAAFGPCPHGEGLDLVHQVPGLDRGSSASVGVGVVRLIPTLRQEASRGSSQHTPSRNGSAPIWGASTRFIEPFRTDGLVCFTQERVF